MSRNLLLIVLPALGYLLLASAVLIKNPKDWINRHFGIFSVAVAVWTLGNGLVSTYASGPWGYLWGRLTFASASIITVSFFLFVTVFPSATPSLPRFLTRLVVLTGLGIFVSSFSTLIVRETTTSNGALRVVYGPLHPFFGVYFVSCFGLILVLLIQKLRVLEGTQNLQVRYLFLGILITGLGATITNLFFPLVLHTSRFSQYGPLFGIFMIAMIAHAIVRHRLMNIRLVIRRGVVLLLAVAISGGVFVGLLWLITTAALVRPDEVPFWVEVALVVLIAILFHPLRQWIHTYLDRYLYREPYDYQRTIREASRTIGSILDLKSLLNYVCEVIGRTIRPETVTIYIRNEDGTGYIRRGIRNFIDDSSAPDREATLPLSSPLIGFLSRSHSHFLRDEAKRVTSNSASQEALKQLILLRGEMALPILHEENLTGFLIVGSKLSGDPYFAEDIDLVSTLVGQAAIAIKNAQLYQEVTLVNEYVANIVATMESGVIAVGANGKVTLFNPAAERMTGLSAQSARSGLIGSLPVTLAQALEATLADGQSRFQPETTIPDTTGRLTPISYSTYPLRDHSGTALGAVTIFADLTRLKELEGERRRAERLASFGALASGIAHEIKNPLVAIKTFAELLPERFAEEDFREDFSKVVVREIDRIDDLVARLRGLAAPSTQPLAPLDLREPIEDTLALLRAQLEQNGIRLHRFYDPVVPPVAGDPAQLKQLFLNLFMNALEAMESGGELTIELRARSRHGSSTVLARVSDTGSGIPESLMGKIFDPFVTTKSRGSGLGLAICRRITDAHGATIRADNNPDGRGSTIAVAFPAVAAMALTINEIE